MVRRKSSLALLLEDLKVCSQTRNLERGKQAHGQAVQHGHDFNIYVASALVNMYSKCGSMVDARRVFDKIQHPNVVSWNSLILGYADNGQGNEALELFNTMMHRDLIPNSTTFVAALKACTSLVMKERPDECIFRGRELHELAMKYGCGSNIYVQNTLIYIYSKSGYILDARQVFENMEHPNLVSWNALILGYAENGHGRDGLELLKRMMSQGHEPNSLTFVAALKACIAVGLQGCRAMYSTTQAEVRDLATKHGCATNVYVQNTLIDMYRKCGSMVDARKVFDSMEHPTVVSWTALILGYAENGQGVEGLELFRRMRSEGHIPNSVTFVAALKSCDSLVVRGNSNNKCIQGIHRLAVDYGCDSDTSLQSALIEMYAKSSCIKEAHHVFDSMKHPDVVSWNVLILGYAENGQGHASLDLFTRMKNSGTAPDGGTFVAVLKGCSSLAVQGGAIRRGKCRELGRALHLQAIKCGYFSDVYVQSTLIDMYAKCGNMKDAREVFESMKHRDVVAWTVLMFGYVDNGEGSAALELFSRMRETGLMPNSATFVAALKACTSLASKERAECIREIHNLALKCGCGCDAEIKVQSTLIDMYVKCGSFVDAREVFEGINGPDVVCWNVMILAYADAGQGAIALTMFTRMRSEGCAPDSATFVSVLKACTSMFRSGKVECKHSGQAIHTLAVKNGLHSDIYVQSTLIDMYAKCGSMVDAQNIFDNMQLLDVVSWNVLILGYVDNAQARLALDILMKMRFKRFQPDSVTFLAALKACTLLGDLESGRAIHSDIKVFDANLLSCLIDFYAKCGSIVEAQNVFDQHAEHRVLITWNAMLAGVSTCGDHNYVFELFKQMQDQGCQPDAVTFISILTCCNHAGLVEKGKECFDSMSTRFKIMPCVEHYTCMADIFGRANKLEYAMSLLQLMPCSANDVTWRTVLGACCKWKNVTIGRLAFRSLMDLKCVDGAAFVLMEQLYGRKGDCFQTARSGIDNSRLAVAA